jgi:hypothetical protein
MTSHELVYKPPARDVSDVHDPVVEEAEAVPRSGPAAAVVAAAGLGCFVLGLLSVLAAASVWVSETLAVSDRVGEMSGLSLAAVAVFFASWAGLTVAWRRANPPLLRVAAASGALIVLGLLGTFPPFFNLFD